MSVLDFQPDAVMAAYIRSALKLHTRRENARRPIRKADVARIAAEAFGPISDETRAEDRRRIADQQARDWGLGGLF